MLFNPKDMGRKLKSGLFIVFEGIDGVGKTTHAKKLVKYLCSKGYNAVYTTEPTNWSEYGKKIRKSFTLTERLPVQEEFKLFLEDRKLHVKEEVVPELEKGTIVISDRYYFSSVAYQGANGLDWKYILEKNMAVVFPPDKVLLLDIDVEEALKRINNGRLNGANSFEKRETLQKVDEIFKQLSKKFPQLFTTINSGKEIQEVHYEITSEIERLLQAYSQKEHS